VAGKTSFTAGEARAWMEKRGYSLVREPVKGADGVWYAEARKGTGAPVRVMVDYQGNVFETAPARGPVPGATNLSLEQARDLMMKRGYRVSSIPIKDDQGIWYAEGSLGEGPPMQVMVDHQGNVFESGMYSGHPNSAPGTPPGPANPVRPAPPAANPAGKAQH
jgi:CBS domain-containing protein